MGAHGDRYLRPLLTCITPLVKLHGFVVFSTFDFLDPRGGPITSRPTPTIFVWSAVAGPPPPPFSALHRVVLPNAAELGRRIETDDSGY